MTVPLCLWSHVHYLSMWRRAGLSFPLSCPHDPPQPDDCLQSTYYWATSWSRGLVVGSTTQAPIRGRLPEL